MPDAPRPSEALPTTVAASLSRPDAKRLRALAAERQVSMTQLIRSALTQTYGIPEPRDEGS